MKGVKLEAKKQNLKAENYCTLLISEVGEDGIIEVNFGQDFGEE